MAEAALLLAIFGLPVAVIVLLFAIERRARKLRKQFGLGEFPPSKPAIDDVVAGEGKLVLAKRVEVVEPLIELDRASSYGKNLPG